MIVVSRPWLVCYVADGWTLVRGLEARRLLTLFGHRPRWSATGRGWTVHDATVADDLQAYANSIGTFIAISHRRPE